MDRIVIQDSIGGFRIFDTDTRKVVWQEQFVPGSDFRTKANQVFEAGRRFQAGEIRRATQYGVSHTNGGKR